jgi:hypothetical protein
MKFPTISLLAFTSLTSAWHLQLYRNAGYQVKILDVDDIFSHDCTNLDPQLRDQTSSMHWETGGVFDPCTVHLYLRVGCSVPIVVKTRNTDIVNFANEGVNDQVSSWKVVCGEDVG